MTVDYPDHLVTVCYGVVPRDEPHACGVFELRQLQPGFLRGERALRSRSGSGRAAYSSRPRVAVTGAQLRERYSPGIDSSAIVRVD
jgi:hypothetical protein